MHFSPPLCYIFQFPLPPSQILLWQMHVTHSDDVTDICDPAIATWAATTGYFLFAEMDMLLQTSL